MLIDIFARRYEATPLRDAFEQRDQRLLLQAYRILSEDVHPPIRGGKKDEQSEKFWLGLHDGLSRELGLMELGPRWFFTTANYSGNTHRVPHENTSEARCQQWFVKPVQGDPDAYIKERLSLIELGFRKYEAEIVSMNAAPIPQDVDRLVSALSSSNTIRVPGSRSEGMRAWRETRTTFFQKAVEELNARFSQARYGLHYHNGFIQASTDELIQAEVETPFWALVAGPLWANVDHDMKEALDRRDGGERDPAFYAARALESTIKIISEKRGWTTGNEKGAHNYIDTLASKSNKYIERWEAESLKAFFTEIRNPMGHGPGSAEMPELSPQQTEWAIEFSMSWIKNLIRRL